MDEGAPLTGGGVEDVDVGVDVGVIGAGDLERGGGGKHQDVGAGGVLRGVELRRLHVQGGAPAKHGACGDGVWEEQRRRVNKTQWGDGERDRGEIPSYSLTGFWMPQKSLKLLDIKLRLILDKDNSTSTILYWSWRKIKCCSCRQERSLES